MRYGKVQMRSGRKAIGRLGQLILVVSLLVWGGAACAWGQADTGRISGTVKDSSGAVIPHAAVVATHTETGETTTATTDASGVYTFASLLAGTYNITATAKGFATTSHDGFVVSDGSAITANLDLKPSGNAEEITIVTTSVDQVNTQTGEVSHVIDGDTVRDLALNGRNYLDLLGTLPGSVQAGLGDSIAETTSMSTTNINLNGARATSNGLYIDGFLNKDIGSNAAQFNNVGIDFIAHVKVQTSSFSAQYGSAAGPTVNVVTRSGANTIHGTAFEFIRNSAVDATNYFSRNPLTFQPIHAHLRYNDFGGAIGGPIVIPHLLDGHDKLFFFIGAEWKLIAQTDQPALQTLPLQSQVNGIFPGTLSDGCAFSSFTYFVNGNLTTQKTPAGCNITPFISSFGRAFQNEMNYVISQATTYAGTACTLTDCSNNGNVLYELPQPFRNHEYMARVDWTISRRQSMYGRWMADTHTTNDPIGDGATPVTPYHDEAPANNVLLSHSYVVTQNAVNEISFGALFASTNLQPLGTSWLRSSYGYSYQPYYVNSYKIGVPGVGLYGYSALDSDSYMRRYHPSYFQLQDIYTLVKARQTFKFGALIGRNRADTNGQTNYMGAFSFTPSGTTPYSTGNPIADAELGNFSSYAEVPSDTYGQFRLTSYAAFVDDVWRASSKLSINAGLRFEHLTPWTAVQDNLSDFYPNAFNPTQAVQVNVDGTVVAGVGNPNNGLRRAGSGVPTGQDFRVPNATAASVLAVPTSGSRGFYKSQYVVMPRLSFAYDLFGNGQTAFRGGLGLFYDTPQTNANFSTLDLPPYVPNVNINNGNADNLATYATKQYPFAAMYTLDPNFQRTYVYQYNFGLQ
jgi:outer membrane receptor protein involved in Fe transport